MITLAVVLAVVAFLMALGALLLSVYTWGFVNYTGHVDQRGLAGNADNADTTERDVVRKDLGVGSSKVPDEPPEVVAPNLRNPPKIRGGFGSRMVTDASHVSGESEISREGNTATG
jgi:hypothetical protein